MEPHHSSAWGARGGDHWMTFMVTRQKLAQKQVLEMQWSILGKHEKVQLWGRKLDAHVLEKGVV